MEEGASIDMGPTNEALGKIADALSGDAKKFFKEVAMRLFANSDFEHSSKSAAQIADEAIERAAIFASKLDAALS